MHRLEAFYANHRTSPSAVPGPARRKKDGADRPTGNRGTKTEEEIEAELVNESMRAEHVLGGSNSWKAPEDGRSDESVGAKGEKNILWQPVEGEPIQESRSDLGELAEEPPVVKARVNFIIETQKEKVFAGMDWDGEAWKKFVMPPWPKRKSCWTKLRSNG